MAFRLVSSGGSVSDPAFINIAASGVIHSGEAVEFVRTSTFANGTGGALVGPVADTTTSTAIFGVALGYVVGASDSYVNVVPFNPSQLWEVDCANAATTAQLGLRFAVSASRGYIHNTATDIGMAAAKATRSGAVFLSLAMVGSASGSGKLIGRFILNQEPVIIDTQT